MATPTKTSGDLQRIINIWLEYLSNNENNLLDYAQQLNAKQDKLNKTTETFIQTQDLLAELEENLDRFQLSIETLTKYNDELDENIQQLNTESKTLRPNIQSNPKVEQDRTIIYEQMEAIDNDFNQLQQTITEFNEQLQINTDNSIIKTTEDLQTCFHEINSIQQTIQQINS